MAPLSQATSPPEMVAGEKMPARGRSAQQPQVSAQPSSHPPSHNQGATPTRSRERTSWLTRLKEFSRTFYKQRDFVYLALLAGVMIIINIVQVALIKYLHSWGWIVGFPASVFGFSILLLLARALLNWKELVDTWKNIDWQHRAAQVGIILSILLPIIFCEFVYLPAVAIPAINRVQWSTSIQAEQSQIPPAILLVPDNPYITFFSQGTNASASVQYGSGTYSEGEVSPVGQYRGLFPDEVEFPIQWLSFTPHIPEPGVNLADLAMNWSWSLSVNFTYNSTDPYIPGYNHDPNDFVPSIMVVLYDSTLPLNFSDVFNECGAYSQRPLELTLTIPALYAGLDWPVQVETFRINDEVRELYDAETNYTCRQYVDDYKYYVAQPPALSWDKSLADYCDVGQNGTAPCETTLYFELISPLITTQTSRRGTNTLKILIDEGSILGAIQFITWFFGIFII